MNFKIKFVIFNDEEKKFVKDDNEYIFELDEELEESYGKIKKSDKEIYSFFKNDKSFLRWIKEEVYADQDIKEIGISMIGDISYLRFWFFKVESSDTHYEYFSEYFDIFFDDLYHSRSDIGNEILDNLVKERKNMTIDVSSIVVEEESEEEAEIA
jgi:hypothetical protein